MIEERSLRASKWFIIPPPSTQMPFQMCTVLEEAQYSALVPNSHSGQRPISVIKCHPLSNNHLYAVDMVFVYHKCTVTYTKPWTDRHIYVNKRKEIILLPLHWRRSWPGVGFRSRDCDLPLLYDPSFCLLPRRVSVRNISAALSLSFYLP